MRKSVFTAVILLIPIVLTLTSCKKADDPLNLELPSINPEGLEGEELDEDRQMAGWQLDATGTFSYLEYTPKGSSIPYFDERYDYNDNYFIYETTVNGEKMYGYMDHEFNRISNPVSSVPAVFMFNLAYARIDNNSAVIDSSFQQVDTYFNNFVKKGNTLLKVDWTSGPDENPYYIEDVDFDKYLVPVMLSDTSEGVRWGYKTFNDVYIGTRSGESEFRIEPIFEDAGGFFEGLAAVKLGGKWGYIDEAGDIVIECMYDRVAAFREGAGRVFLSECKVGEIDAKDRWALIDSQGNLLTDFSYTSIGDFDRGVAIAEITLTNTSNRGQVNVRTSQTYLKADGTDLFGGTVNSHPLQGFSEDKAIFRSASSYFYIDREGKRAVPGNYQSASDFSDGFAAVKKSRSSMRWGYINEFGTLVISESYIMAKPFDDGFAYVRDKMTPNGFLIDKGERKYLEELNLSGISRFNSDGYALAYADLTVMQTKTNPDTGESWEEEVQEIHYYMIHIE